MLFNKILTNLINRCNNRVQSRKRPFYTIKSVPVKIAAPVQNAAKKKVRKVDFLQKEPTKGSELKTSLQKTIEIKVTLQQKFKIDQFGTIKDVLMRKSYLA